MSVYNPQAHWNGKAQKQATATPVVPVVQPRRKTGKQQDPHAVKVQKTSQLPMQESAECDPPEENSGDDFPYISSPSMSSSSSSTSSNDTGSSSSQPVLRKPASKVAKTRPASNQEQHQEEEQATETAMQNDDEEEQPNQTCKPVDALSDTWTACVAALFWFEYKCCGPRNQKGSQGSFNSSCRLP